MGNDIDKWKEDQEHNTLFRGSRSGSDASKMLEISETNRDLSGRQARLIASYDVMMQGLGFVPADSWLNDLPRHYEKAQLVTDNASRRLYAKIAIEQWQGKLANAKNRATQNLL